MLGERDKQPKKRGETNFSLRGANGKFLGREMNNKKKKLNMQRYRHISRHTESQQRCLVLSETEHHQGKSKRRR